MHFHVCERDCTFGLFESTNVFTFTHAYMQFLIFKVFISGHDARVGCIFLGVIPHFVSRPFSGMKILTSYHAKNHDF
jgi:hypothetical protein